MKQLLNTSICLSLIVISFLCSACTDETRSKSKKKDELVIIHTSFGDMKVLLYEETPLHKANFLKLAKSGDYDSTKWHRVIEDFMVQGGDITQKATGAVDNDNLQAEIVEGLYHQKGALAAARKGDQINPEKKSSSCQFYIVDGRPFSESELTIDRFKLQRSIGVLLEDPKNESLKAKFQELSVNGDNQGINELAMSLVDRIEEEQNVIISKEISADRLAIYTQQGGAPHLDGAYTVFGKVVEGLEVIDKLAAVETNRQDRPLDDIFMTMEVVSMKKKDITKQYGYQYP